MKRRRILAGAAGLCALLLTACSSAPSGPPAGSGAASAVDYAALTDALPSNSSPSFSHFSAVDLAGETVTQTVFQGYRLTMVNIWATFCSPCIREMPELGELAEEYADKGVQILGIVADAQAADGALSGERIALAEQIVRQTGADYRHLLPSPDLNKAKLNAVYSVPETIFVDENGKPVGTSTLGSRSKKEWAAILDGLLAGMA